MTSAYFLVLINCPFLDRILKQYILSMLKTEFELLMTFNNYTYTYTLQKGVSCSYSGKIITRMGYIIYANKLEKSCVSGGSSLVN